jgi:ATP-dependent Lon protease
MAEKKLPENKAKPEAAPVELPVVVLREAVMYPRLSAPFAIVDPKSVRALEAASGTAPSAPRLVLCLTQKTEAKDPGPNDLYGVGTVAKVVESMRQPDGTARAFLEGASRVRAVSFNSGEAYLTARVEDLPEPTTVKNERIEALMYSAVNELKEAAGLGAPVPFDSLLVILNVTDPQELSGLIAANVEFKPEERQKILEAGSTEEKLQETVEALGRQIKILKVAQKIEQESGKEMGKMEKEMVLREQMKAIEKELGAVSGVSETEELRAKIAKAGMPQGVKERAEKELARMAGMPSFSPEISYLRTYLDWLIEIPWSKKDASAIDVKKASKILDEDHFGLEKVKERVLEFLSVQKLTGKQRGPILCFAGPPGTGKTSIGKSIARSMGRKFVRISLGGVRDEAEIRGFRRTYVGALPGRIIQGLCTAGSKNPVFMLDEIDKLGQDAFRGDPSSALLEALDPEQNHAFSDHYVEEPVDLSDVVFITTANLLDSIPPALRDRMEVIDFPGYTEEEKFSIAKKYLLPKALDANGLAGKNVGFSDQALRSVISSYTREAGVRNLERQIGSACRKAARAVAEGKTGRIEISPALIKDYLGPETYHPLEAEKSDEIGVATGLAWTQAGGEILPIEVNKMPGSGKLILTGNLGQVMQESAQAAFSYARALAASLKLKDRFYHDSDIHIHVPQGAIPKDGPSAGVAMATAIVSAVLGIPIRRTVAMTGEVTLRGRALEIGGVKEKVLAAHRAGIRTIVLPKDNEKDLPELPKNVREAMKFVLAGTMKEVLAAALAKPLDIRA